MTFSQNWNLEKFFNGKDAFKELEKEENSFKKDLTSFGNRDDFVKEIVLWQSLKSRMRQMEAYLLCLTAQNVSDEKAIFHTSVVRGLSSELEICENSFLEKLSKLKESEFKTLLSNPKIKESSYHLKKKRELFKQQGSSGGEKIVSKLSVDGYHGWCEMYTRFVGEIKIPYKKKMLSFGQTANFLQSRSRNVRKTVFQTWNKICEKESHIFSEIMNHLSGFRLKLYESRNWKSHLFEPLFHNNMDEKSLCKMWDVVDTNKEHFKKFLKAKAKIFKLKKLAWYDLESPFGTFDDTISYKDAAKECINSFKNISPKMGVFVERAFSEKWIEAEDRSKKAAGGFCIAYPKDCESRIFMTYAKTHDNMVTLAHELGHAYHNEAVFGLDEFSQSFPMSLAEMASTVAERVLLDNLLDKAKNKKERAALLHNKIQRTILYFCNIRARFIFEDTLYNQRKNGQLTSKEISDIMINAQKKAYFSSLSEYYPQFWMTKQHFYFTHLPFYNFPYTVGYMFSLRVYAEAKKRKEKFTEWYDALLADTGKMSLEDIAKKHFGEDLHKDEFWQKAVDETLLDINEFLEIV